MFSLEDLSPFSIVPRDHMLTVLKSYFDGGNEADSKQYEILTLAAFSGAVGHWRKFDREWKTTVCIKHGAEYVHTTDAISLKRSFAEWTHKKVEALLSDCVAVIERHAAIPYKRLGLLPVT